MASSCSKAAYCDPRPSLAAYGPQRRSPSFEGDVKLEDLLQEQKLDDEEDVEEGFVDTLFGSEYREEMMKAREEEVKREAEKKRREAEEMQREAERRRQLLEEAARRREKHDAAIEMIREYNPKEKIVVYTRFPFEDLSTFDLDEESDIPPMRYTGTENLEQRVSNSVNIFSLKIVSSDVGFPISVYGTVIARDGLDYKCIYLFRRQRGDSQLINSEDQSLTLTGPARGIILLDYIFLEVDLKIEGDQGQDKQLSKGLLEIDGRVLFLDKDIESTVKQLTCASYLSTVKVDYGVVKDAVEATVEFWVLQGDFNGTITGCTDRLDEKIVLYDSKASGVVTSVGGGIIQLRRRVIAVCWEHMLVLTIATTTSERKIEFTPFIHADNYDFYVDAVQLRAKVTWSLWCS